MADGVSQMYGIDLGTTNSSLAVLLGERIYVVPSTAGDDTIPSVVTLKHLNGRVECVAVGRRARDMLAHDPRSVVQLVKKYMGVADWRFQVADSDKSESAAEISSRILIELSENLKRARKRDSSLPGMTGAVITVPAIFNQAARDETRRAGELAGLGHIELFAEPSAAALAFGHALDTSESAIWLAYDLGGGTFDCALVKAHGGVFDVVDTGGDRSLGGSNLDAAIVEKLMLPLLPPEAQQEVRKREGSAWWKLLYLAEHAKILLDVDDEVSITDDLYLHGENRAFVLNITLHRKDVEALQVEIFGRTLRLCQDLLDRNGFEPAHIERVLLIGGQTRSDFLRHMIRHGGKRADGTVIQGLGIELDYSIDPMTAVAKGAALYAASLNVRRGTEEQNIEGPSSVARITLHSGTQVLPDDDDLLVAGSVIPPGGQPQDASGWAIRIERLDGDVVGWHSEPVAVNVAGGFTRRVPLLSGRNVFQILVLDEARRQIATDSSARFEIFRGIKIGEPKMENGLGVADATGKTVWFFRKGEHLPAGPKSLQFRTKVDLVRESNEVVIVPIVEGNHDEASLNFEVHTLRISYTDVARAHPKGSELVITLALDESRQMSVLAEFVASKARTNPAPSPIGANEEFIKQKLALVKKNLDLFRRVGKQSKPISQVVAQIDDEMLIPEIEDLLSEGSPHNPLPWERAKALVLELLILQHPHLSEVDGLLIWETNVQRWQGNVDRAREIVAEEPRPKDWEKEFDALCDQYKLAVSQHDGEKAEGIAYGLIPDHFKKLPALQVRVGGGTDVESGPELTRKQQTKGNIEKA